MTCEKCNGTGEVYCGAILVRPPKLGAWGKPMERGDPVLMVTPEVHRQLMRIGKVTTGGHVQGIPVVESEHVPETLPCECQAEVSA